MSFSQKQLLKNRIILFGIIFSLFSFSFICFRFSLKLAKNPFFFISSLFYVIIGFLAYPLYIKLWKKLDFIENKILDEIDKSKRGNEGEIKVFSQLDRILDKNLHTIHKNLVLPNYNFDIDMVVIGSKGIILFEIKNYTNQIIFSRGGILVKTDEKKLALVSPERDPRNQLKRHLDLFKKYLIYSGFNNISINNAVIFVGEYSVLIEKNVKTKTFIISGVEEIEIYIKSLPDNPRFTKDFCSKINNLLKKK